LSEQVGKVSILQPSQKFLDKVGGVGHLYAWVTYGPSFAEDN
jgi:hypothetical protein